MKNIDSYNHLSGTSVYLDDIPEIAGTLYGACYDSSVAHGEIISLDVSAAEVSEGVVKIFTCNDIPGRNQIGGIVEDEELLAEKAVHFCGMPIAFVVARSEEAARRAVKKIKADISPLPVITDPREAKMQNKLIVPPRTFSMGDAQSAFTRCDYIFEGHTETNGQEQDRKSTRLNSSHSSVSRMPSSA